METIIDIISKIIIPLLAVLGTSLGAYAAFRKLANENEILKANAKKEEADAAGKITDSALKLVDDRDQTITEIKEQLKCQSNRINDMTAEIVLMKQQQKEDKSKIENLTTLTAYLLRGVRELLKQIEKDGKEPSWIPDNELINKLSN